MGSDGPVETDASDGGVSRRKVLGGAGAALAGGLVAGAATSAVAAPLAAATDSGSVAAGGPATTVIEFLCRISQSGVHFAGLGYLTGVAGVDADALFAGSPRDEAHALMTATATGTLVSRSVDGAVHALDITGELSVFLRSGPGASWSNPSSFSAGKRLAEYSLDLQDVLTVIAPNTGLPVLNGLARQVDGASYRGRSFGRKGLALRFEATGLGVRSDGGGSDVTNAQAALTVAGGLFAV
jgi:hypothetical protein